MRAKMVRLHRVLSSTSRLMLFTVVPHCGRRVRRCYGSRQGVYLLPYHAHYGESRASLDLVQRHRCLDHGLHHTYCSLPRPLSAGRGGVGPKYQREVRLARHHDEYCVFLRGPVHCHRLHLRCCACVHCLEYPALVEGEGVRCDHSRVGCAVSNNMVRFRRTRTLD